MNLTEALIARRTGARPIAGATDIYPAALLRLGKVPERLPSLIDLSRIATLRCIEVDRGNGRVRIGAMSTWSDVAEFDLPPGFESLVQTARQIGSWQIQTRGTIGGNVCNASPAADGVVTLMALHTVVELTSSTGTRRLPLGDFVLGNRRTALREDEILTALEFALPRASLRSAFVKLGNRAYLSISDISACLVLQHDGGAITAATCVVGACSEVPMRLPDLEAALVGEPFDGRAARVVSASQFACLKPIDDLRANARFRRDVAPALLCHAVHACIGAATPQQELST